MSDIDIGMNFPDIAPLELEENDRESEKSGSPSSSSHTPSLNLTRLVAERVVESPSTSSKEMDAILKSYKDLIERDPNISLTVATVRTMTEYIKFSTQETAQGLIAELEMLRALLIDHELQNKIAIDAGANLFMKFFFNLKKDIGDFRRLKRTLIQNGESFSGKSIEAREKVASFGSPFVKDGFVILTHGYSRASMTLFKRIAMRKTRFRVITTEGAPDMEGKRTATELGALGITVELIPDSAVGYVFKRVNLVIIGAEAVAENGGIINKIGTYQIALIAKAFGTPVYVAVESYKFTRIFPLSQDDLQDGNVQPEEFVPSLEEMSNVTALYPRIDFTPPHYISQLFTNIGVFAPAAVSDELMKLFI